MGQTVEHDTIIIREKLEASAEEVFAAWEDPKARMVWGVPSDDEAIAFLENDFRVGGLDVHQCGQKGDLRFRVETRYQDIRRPDLLLFTERVSTGDMLLSASLITVVLKELGSATELGVTVQVTSMVGADMIEATRGGWQASLARLAGYLERSLREQSGA
ncbi:SRPBCC family protein [Pseudovibrio brasiliensis]|uniref:SRPBCC family protein n=1 Tax=Pseudovibrio brasiliensis TaxID=1898042 RepID=A0ABX8AI31_9HYPH|nr:SRPBCC family protein [Pseudovibrio brasiliensis]QUS54679.1 SRPBCC family protein [Pseudovibrio brasiliensis]